jgi:hypothetical protein
VRILPAVGNKGSDYAATDVETVQLVGKDLWRMLTRQRRAGPA